MTGHQLLERLAGRLTATVGVRQQRVRLAAPPDRDHQGIGDDLAVIAALIDQPTTRRENRSMTAPT
jgi:hypothetical protein